jgi:hypothetical protein
MRFVIETYCTCSYPGFFDSDDTLLSIIEKIRNTGEQHPACALLDELDDIHNYSWDHCRDDAPDRDVAEPIDVKELTGYVRRTLKIVNAYRICHESTCILKRQAGASLVVSRIK